MSTAEEVLAFFAERFGPCPYPVINLAFAEAALPGGHSPPGLIVLMRRPPLMMGQPLPNDPASFGDKPDFYLAHEVAHQWWGQGVAPASYREQWLSEAWSQYAAALWVRHRSGEDAFLDMLERMASWARKHDEEGPIHLGQRLGHLKRDRRIRRALVYNKGAWVLHMLRGLLGDEAFFGGARNFLERHRFGRATTEDLRTALEEASGQDLAPYFERWIYGTGLPTLLWSAQTRKTPDGYETTVQVQPQDLPGPLPLEIGFQTRGERQVRRVMLEPAGGTWTLNSPDPVRGLQLDENEGILAAKVKKVRRLPRPPQR
jgi:aminopeptidase N